jgi:hypothetical protein
LIDRNTGTNVRGALFHPDASEECAIGAGMVTGTVRASRGMDVVKATHHLDVFAH